MFKSFLGCIVSLLFIQVIYAQNYTNIASPGTTFFRHHDEWLRGYRYDSVKAAGSDTIYFAPRVILRNPDSFACSDTSNGPVLSMSIVKKSDGTFVFLNRDHDSIMFRTQAAPDESWVCMMLFGNVQMKAKVTDIRIDSVMDTVNQVKEITFQAEFLNGTVYPHVMNGVKVRLSKEFGFATTLDWNVFPDDTVGWKLAGKGAPKRGIQDFSVAECYDFQPGDVFHLYRTERYNNATFYVSKIKTILTRSDYPDSVVYTTELCTLTKMPVPPPNIVKSWDTVTEKIVFNDIFFDKYFSKLPDQYFVYQVPPYRVSRYFKSSAGFNGHPTKGVSPEDYCCGRDCWLESTMSDFYGEYTFAAGLGEVLFRDYYGDMGSFVNKEESLVYYHKGNEEWGTPLAPSCNILLTADELLISDDKGITISPNPVQTISLVNLEFLPVSSRASWQLADITGRLVRQGATDGNSFVLDRSGLHAGCYMLRVSVPGSFTSRQVKVIIR